MFFFIVTYYSIFLTVLYIYLYIFTRIIRHAMLDSSATKFDSTQDKVRADFSQLDL